MTPKNIHSMQTSFIIYHSTIPNSYSHDTEADRGKGDETITPPKERPVPTLVERLLLACVSLALLLFASFVTNLYFPVCPLVVRFCLSAILLLFFGLVLLVNILFNRSRLKTKS